MADEMSLKATLPKVPGLNNKMVKLIVIGMVTLLMVILGAAMLKTSKIEKADEEQELKAVPVSFDNQLPSSVRDAPTDYSQVEFYENKDQTSGAPEKDKSSAFDDDAKKYGVSDDPVDEVKQRKTLDVSIKFDNKYLNENENRSVQTASSGDQSKPYYQAPAAPSLGGFGEDPAKTQNMQKEKKDFLEQSKRDDVLFLGNQIVPPASPYQLNAGTILPGSLITGLNSDLPGLVIGQIRENVYDSVTGKHLLIPQGTKVIGEYDSMVAYGQNRALMVWKSLNFPNGDSLNLGGMSGSDLAGYAGITDKVDYHILPLMGAIVMSTMFSVGAQEAAGDVQGNYPTTTQQFASSAAQSASETGGKIVDRFLNRQPTITVRPGFSFNVLIGKNIVLKPYKGA